jgi:tellurite resistance-related uncharacterized protein
MVSQRLSAEYSVFYAFYIQKEQIAGAKNDHATRKSPGNILCVRALLLILSKENPPKMYKIQFATESDEWCLNSCLKNIVSFMHFVYKKNKLQDKKMTMPRGNLLEIFFG